MKTAAEQAEENQRRGYLMTNKRKEFAPPQGKIVFSKPEGKGLQINIVNSPIAYSPDKRQAFGEMIQVLQAEEKIGVAGSILISQLEAM